MRLPLVLCLLASPAMAEAPRIVTDFLPTASLTAMVTGDLTSPQILLPKGADVHDFQLRPSQARTLTDADLVIWIGPDMTPWLAHALKGLGADAPRLTLIDLPETHSAPYPESGQLSLNEGTERSATAPDPHIWLDPENAMLWLPKIATELARIDPEHAEIYFKNAEISQAKLAALDTELKATLAPVAKKPFITFHNAYGYFAAHYSLQLAGAIRDGDAATPGAAHLRMLKGKVDQGDAVCVFPEAGHDEGLARQLVEGTKARLGPPLDPEGTTLAPGAGAYPTLLRALAQSIAGCLSGPDPT